MCLITAAVGAVNKKTILKMNDAIFEWNSLFFGSSGWFGETTGKYRNLFFLAGAPTICGAVVFSLIQCIKDPIIESQQKRALVIPTEEKEIIFVYDRLTVV